MKNAFALGGPVALEDLVQVSLGRRRPVFSKGSRRRTAASRKALERALSRGRLIYGVNTGFGELANRRISLNEARLLQKNLILSHACGLGEPLSPEEVRAMIFLRANELARGYSGVRPELIEALLGLARSRRLPKVPSQGSVGASGDLAPLAHVALEVLRRLELEPKEGISLVNGTQAMQAVGALALAQAFRVFEAALKASALSLEALKGTPVPFDARLQALKPHEGQGLAAKRLRELLSGSEIRRSHLRGDLRVQDPYSLRCIPQVYGPVWETLSFARRLLETEMNSVTDNPVVLSERSILSGGNFHGQALSFAFDFAAVSLTALGNMSERRIFQLIGGADGILPPFLAQNPGLESGWMIAQVAAAALASENKILSHPASADSIPTSGNKEDFVSMGMTSALKFKKVVLNVSRIAAIESLAAARGVEMHLPLKPGKGVREHVKFLRTVAPSRKGDFSLSRDIEKVGRAIRETGDEAIG